jgi:hypothetical protein
MFGYPEPEIRGDRCPAVKFWPATLEVRRHKLVVISIKKDVLPRGGASRGKGSTYVGLAGREEGVDGRVNAHLLEHDVGPHLHKLHGAETGG